TQVIVAELNLPSLLELYPPRVSITPLPSYPAIERDLSVLVDETVAWGAIEDAVHNAQPALLEGLTFVGVYRGKQIGAGKKSVTFRLRFRDPERTLRHDEVDPQMRVVVDALAYNVNATLRA